MAQQDLLMPWLSALGNVSLGARLQRRDARPDPRPRDAGARGPRRRSRCPAPHALRRHAPAGRARPHPDGRQAHRAHGRALLRARRDHADALAGACRRPPRRAHGAAGDPRPARGAQAGRAESTSWPAARRLCSAPQRPTARPPRKPGDRTPADPNTPRCWNGSLRPTMPAPTRGPTDGQGLECASSG